VRDLAPLRVRPRAPDALDDPKQVHALFTF
jgi:hypothetical protein